MGGGNIMASGDTLVIFTPLNNEPPSSNYATFDTRNLHTVLDFDDTTAESAVFKGIMPQNYGGASISVLIHFSMATATTNSIFWSVAIENITTTLDIDTDSFSGFNGDTDTLVPTVSGEVDIVGVAFESGADMDSLSEGNPFRIKIRRGAAEDNATGDAELYAVEIRET
jgi:hypothetical protein